MIQILISLSLDMDLMGIKQYYMKTKDYLMKMDAVVQPIEVYFEEKETNFVSVKEGTTQFVDFDSDGKLDIIFSGQSDRWRYIYMHIKTLVIIILPSVDIGHFHLLEMVNLLLVICLVEVLMMLYTLEQLVVRVHSQELHTLTQVNLSI